LKTSEHRKLRLENLPDRLLQNGIHTHGLDLFIHPEPSDSDLETQSAETESKQSQPRHASLYLINHRFPDDDQSSGTADSVIEVFDTTIGSDQATHRRTIQHDLIVTPNNLVALNQDSFYVTNDHRRKKHWVCNHFPPSRLIVF
jgi:hypothetical protein